jgi:hypothetical protein
LNNFTCHITTLADLKNRAVFTLYPQGEQTGFSAFTPWGRGKKAGKTIRILFCQSSNILNPEIMQKYLIFVLETYASSGK